MTDEFEIIPFDVMQQIAPVVLSHLRDVVRPLVIKRAGGQPGCGSGQVLKIGDHYALITAAHVLVHHPEFLDKPDQVCTIGLSKTPEMKLDSLYWLDDRPRAQMWLEAGTATGPDGQTHKLDFDVAVIEMAEEEVQAWGVAPITIEQMTPRLLVEPEMIFLVGYPGEMYDKRRAAEGVVRARWFALPSRAVAEEMWPDRWSPATHQVALWDSEGTVHEVGGRIVPAKLPDPKGISGCGMWTIIQQEGAMFNPLKCVFLAGIQYAYSERRRAVVGCNAHVILSAVAATFPDTEEIVTAHGFNVGKGPMKVREVGPGGVLVPLDQASQDATG